MPAECVSGSGRSAGRDSFVRADDGVEDHRSPRQVSAVSHEPPDAGEFRVAYREFLEELVRLAPSWRTGPPPWADALIREPLEFPAELVRPELAATRQRFAAMLRRFASADLEAYREIARSVLHAKFDLQSAAPPPPDDEYAAASPVAAPAPAPPRAPPAPPAAAPPPPRSAPPGLGDRLRSVFGGLRRRKPTHRAPIAACTDERRRRLTGRRLRRLPATSTGSGTLCAT